MNYSFLVNETYLLPSDYQPQKLVPAPFRTYSRTAVGIGGILRFYELLEWKVCIVIKKTKELSSFVS
jgi:hypothetical protein